MNVNAMLMTTSDILGYDAGPSLDVEDLAAMAADEFTTNIILEMREQGLEFEDLADRLGYSQGQLETVLSSSDLTLTTMATLARALNKTIEAPALISL